MNLRKPHADIFVPDGTPIDEALSRVTRVAIAAHQDDIEIMAYHGVLEAFATPGEWFLAVVVTDGAGSPREDHYADYTDAQMKQVRLLEQRKAAYVGEYGACLQLGYSSSEVKNGENTEVIDDLRDILLAARPEVVYTHNLADKHDTHVSTALRAISALQLLAGEYRPEAFYGCEVWRDLDWMCDPDKVALDVAAHEAFAASLLGVFDSQIAGGKRYDLATMGRRRAHATYHASHGVDTTTGLTFAMDLLPLLDAGGPSPDDHARAHILRFLDEVSGRVRKFETSATLLAEAGQARKPWRRPLVRTKHRG